MGEAQITNLEDHRAPRDATEFGNDDEIHLHKAHPRLMRIDAAREVVANSFSATENTVRTEYGLTPDQEAEYYSIYADRVGLVLAQAREDKLVA